MFDAWDVERDAALAEVVRLQGIIEQAQAWAHRNVGLWDTDAPSSFGMGVGSAARDVLTILARMRA